MVTGTVQCPHCAQAQVEIFRACPHCGVMVEPEDIVRSLTVLLELLSVCVQCKTKAFDGWKCHKCKREIPEKAKRMRGCVLLNEKEREAVNTFFS